MRLGGVDALQSPLVTTVALLVALAILASIPSTTSYSLQDTGELSSFDSRIGGITHRISRLQEMGANVSSLIVLVNKAVDYAENGDYTSANRILNSVEENITRMEPIVEHQHMIRTVERYVLVGLLLALPLLVYWGLPRLYLYLWFRVKRRWIVEE